MKELSPRQHRFALNILAGMPPKKAYVEAGYSSNPKTLTGDPYMVLNAPHVQAFIQAKQRLKESVVLATDINNNIATPTERKEILTELVRARLVDMLKDGEIEIDKDTPGVRAVKAYEKRSDRRGNSVQSIKLTDIIEAIKELNKMTGAYAPSRHMVAHRGVFEVVHKEGKGD